MWEEIGGDMGMGKEEEGNQHSIIKRRKKKKKGKRIKDEKRWCWISENNARNERLD